MNIALGRLPSHSICGHWCFLCSLQSLLARLSASSEEQRIILRNRAAQELRLQTSARANTLDEEGSSQEIDSRKRPREMADTDPGNVHQSRKPRTAKEGDEDATVAIISGSSYQAPRTEDGATGTAFPIAAAGRVRTAMLSDYEFFYL